MECRYGRDLKNGSMKSELVLVRVAQPSTTGKQPSSPPPPPHPSLLSSPTNSFTGVAQWNPNQARHFAALTTGGVLVTYVLNIQETGNRPQILHVASFQLHISCSRNNGSKLKAMDVQWGSFEFIPKRTNEIVFFQENSSRILFAKLPGAADSSSSPHGGSSWRKCVLGDTNERSAKVYCIGRHPSFLLSIAVSSDGLAMASTTTSGSICVWRLLDGALLCQTNVSFINLRQTFIASTLFQHQAPQHFRGCFGAHQAARNFGFVDKPWGLAMGCQDGKVRLWTMQNGDADPNHLSTSLYLMKFKKLSSSDKASVSAIALHTPQTKEPFILSEDEQLTGRTTLDYLAVGTIEGGLSIWSRHSSFKNWVPTWAAGTFGDHISIICLSFSTDGSLLAAGTSTVASSLHGRFPCQDGSSSCERVFLYETGHWSCVGSLTFKAYLGTCLFYHPAKTERKCMEDYEVLLICTSEGMQAHILPNLVEKKLSPQISGTTKTLYWTDTDDNFRVHVHQGSLQFPHQTSPGIPQHDVSDKIQNRVEEIREKCRVEFITGSLCEDQQHSLGANCHEKSAGKNQISQEPVKSIVMCMTQVPTCGPEEVHQQSDFHIMAGHVLHEPLGLQICRTCGGTIHLHYDDEKENCKNCLIHSTKNYNKKDVMELPPKQSFDLKQQNSSLLHQDEERCQIVTREHTGKEGSSNTKKKQDCNIHPSINASSCRRNTAFEKCEKCGGRRKTDTKEHHHTEVCKVCHHPMKDHDSGAQRKIPDKEERTCVLHPDVQECTEGKEEGSNGPYKQKLEVCQGYCHSTTGRNYRRRSQEVEEEPKNRQKGKMKKGSSASVCLHSAQTLGNKQSKQVSGAELEMSRNLSQRSIMKDHASRVQDLKAEMDCSAAITQSKWTSCNPSKDRVSDVNIQRGEESHSAAVTQSDGSIHADHHHHISRFLEKDPNPFHVHLPPPQKSCLHEQCNHKTIVPINSQASFNITERRRSTEKDHREKFVSYRDRQYRGEACELELCADCCHPIVEHACKAVQTSGGGIGGESESTRAQDHHAVQEVRTEKRNRGCSTCGHSVNGRKIAKHVSKPWLEKLAVSKNIPLHIIQQYHAGRRECAPCMKKQTCVACRKKIASSCRAPSHKLAVAHCEETRDTSLIVQPLHMNKARRIHSKRKSDAVSRINPMIPTVSESTNVAECMRAREEIQGAALECKSLNLGRWLSLLELTMKEENNTSIAAVDSPCKSSVAAGVLQGRKQAEVREQQHIVSLNTPKTLRSPELNSSGWLLAKLQEIQNETFDIRKALELAKARNKVIGKWCAPENITRLRGGGNWNALDCNIQRDAKDEKKQIPQQQYTNLCKIFDPTATLSTSRAQAFVPRKVKKQVDPAW